MDLKIHGVDLLDWEDLIDRFPFFYALSAVVETDLAPERF
jgi:hypothetical protein